MPVCNDASNNRYFDDFFMVQRGCTALALVNQALMHVFQLDIEIIFRNSTKHLDMLEVVFEDWDCRVSIQAKEPEMEDILTGRWTLERKILVFPDETITFRVPINQGHRIKRLFGKDNDVKFKEHSIQHEAIAKQFKKLKLLGDDRKGHSASAAGLERMSFPFDDCTITFEVVDGGSIESIVEMTPYDVLDPLLPGRVQRVINSTNSLLETAQSLQSVLTNVPVTENACQVLEKTIETLGDTHPLAKAVVTALMIPYNLLKNEDKFKQEMKRLVQAMIFACQCLLDIRYHTKTSLAQDLFKKTMKLLRNAAVFIILYSEKDRFRQLIGAQFPTKLERYAKDLIQQKNDFQMVMVLQIAQEVDMITSMTQDDFLKRRLNPVTERRYDSKYLEGTRMKILHDVRRWLQNPRSTENILWIVGAPGAGKTTIAATIANELRKQEYPCARFFAKRDISDLRDAHRIWPSLAYSLANQHDGMKAALMLVLREKKNFDAQDDPVSVQFQKLIKDPLEADLRETFASDSEMACPRAAIIIDALDECISEDGDITWTSLLESLTCWSTLSRAFKLIVTSRFLGDLNKKLSGMSYRINLITGDDVSEDLETNSDIEKLFRETFSRREWLRTGWPGEAAIQKLTKLAAGLFIWADMAINFVAPSQGAGGFDPDERLSIILADARGDLQTDQTNKVALLYARILFEAFKSSRPEERKRAKTILATVILAKEPLQKNTLFELLPSVSRSMVASTLRSLSSIIPPRFSDDSDDTLRICHKTLSDFVLSFKDSSAAFRHLMLVPDGPELHSFLIESKEEEDRRFALACLNLIRHALPSKDVPRVVELLHSSRVGSSGIHYALRYWDEHLIDSGGIWASISPSMKSLANAMKVAYRCLDRFSGELMLRSNIGLSLIESLHRAAEFEVECIDDGELRNAGGGGGHIKTYLQEHEKSAKSLDTVRGEFQVSMSLKQDFDVDHLATSTAEIFLQSRLAPPGQSELDEECVPGTRARIFSEAKEWLENPDAPNLLWIVGAPGAGKSAIATTLPKRSFFGTCLCAKVFAKRDITVRREPQLLWRMLIYELAGLHVGLRGSIMEALLDNPLCDSVDQGRHRSLLFKAIEDQQCITVVAIIDGLDECFTKDNRQWRELLRAVSGTADFPRSFKLVVTSRDLPDIRSALSGVGRQLGLPVGSEATTEVKLDTEIFLRTKLADLPRTSYWLSEDVLRELVQRSAGSFIWARMVVGLVKLNPDGDLKDVETKGAHGSTEAVDDLYGKVLLLTLGRLPLNERVLYRETLSVIVLAKDPLQTDFLETLPFDALSKDSTHQRVANVIDELGSIISREGKLGIRIPHKSFCDFFLDLSRCSGALERLEVPTEEFDSYLIQQSDDSAKLAIGCLRWMNNALKFNAHGIRTSYVLNDKLPPPNLELMGRTLVYACCYWGEHLKRAPRTKGFRAQVRPLLYGLFHENALYWMEVLSLVKAVSLARAALEAAVRLLKGYDDELMEVANDVYYFVRNFEEPITKAASHIYISALPFASTGSRIHEIYDSRFPNLFSVTGDREKGCEDLDDEKAVDSGHDDVVSCLDFFSDGLRFASGSFDKTMRIWNSRTGRPLSSPSKPSSHLFSVAVSPDGNFIAGGNWDGEIQVWDVNINAYSHMHTIKEPGGEIIRSVAFLRRGTCLATGSEDGTIKVWETVSGKLCLGPLTGHGGFVSCIAISTDDTLIVSGSDDKEIRVWDATTGKPRREPLTGHNDFVACLVFSLDGHHLASGSTDNTIRLWNIARGFALTSTTIVENSVHSVCFSLNSQYLISGHYDGALRFWKVGDAKLDELHTSSSHAHTDVVRSISFSPDGMSFASSSNDKSIKVWNMYHTPIQMHSTRGADLNAEESFYDESALDRLGRPVLNDECYIDADGWLRDSRREDANILLWVPAINREFFVFPRNISIIHKNATKLDFSRFAHGENWADCAKPREHEE